MKPLIMYVAKARRLGRDEFLREHADPVIVVDPFITLEETGFQTLVGRELHEGSPMVASLVKREGANAFASMITLGRAGNNDVELKAPGVSKFHAYFQKEGSNFLLVDGNSTYGTFVDGHRLEPRSEKAPLQAGAGIRFGEVSATYYTPAAFFETLERELNPPSE